MYLLSVESCGPSQKIGLMPYTAPVARISPGAIRGICNWQVGVERSEARQVMAWRVGPRRFSIQPGRWRTRGPGQTDCYAGL